MFIVDADRRRHRRDRAGTLLEPDLADADLEVPAMRPNPLSVRHSACPSEGDDGRRWWASCASTTPVAVRWRSAGSRPRRRPGGRVVRGLRACRSGEPRRDRGDGRGRHRHRAGVPQAVDRREASAPPTSSSRWAAATAAPSTPVPATRTGRSTIRPASTSTSYAPSATRSAPACATCSNDSECRMLLALGDRAAT